MTKRVATLKRKSLPTAVIRSNEQTITSLMHGPTQGGGGQRARVHGGHGHSDPDIHALVPPLPNCTPTVGSFHTLLQ